MKAYNYRDKEYFSCEDVRQAIWKSEHKAFGEEPKENKAEFWASLGVEYTEEEDPPIVQHIPTLDEEKLMACGRLSEAFRSWRNDEATLISSLGFTADADERAMIDVSGLVALESQAVFMDANNVPHELTAEQIKVLHKEIIQSGNKAYERKWALRNRINACESLEELKAIELNFEPADFSEVENV